MAWGCCLFYCKGFLRPVYQKKFSAPRFPFFEELVMNLDQGSIRYIEIKDGEKVLYTESNDKPYND
jgi:hypothetical protein